jgi:hypothetical protein
MADQRSADILRRLAIAASMRHNVEYQERLNDLNKELRTRTNTDAIVMAASTLKRQLREAWGEDTESSKLEHWL